ncbi:MAG: hypothetical protein ACRCSU_02470 [Paracoccaceae bacterium]
MTHRLTRISAALLLATGLAACEGDGSDKTRDFGIDGKQLSTMKAGIWIDPEGCQHWIVDDGLEGYLDARVHPNGKPVCSATDQRNSVTSAEDFRR